MKLHIDSRRRLGRRNPLIYGHFIEHFHRQIYGGVFDPGNPLAGKDGFRGDVIKALRRIKAPILRWPGGCFASAYHWMNGVGPQRVPAFDKAWRVEEPNTFGTGEYIAFCRQVGCEPYICANAGSGSAEEMSDWVEYCNLETQGPFAKRRAAHGSAEPYRVRYWSIGNENYLGGEIGAKSPEEWGRLVAEASKMMKRADPSIELSAAAVGDLEWNINLLRSAGERLSWLSLHQYWDGLWQKNDYADYEACMAYTNTLETPVKKVRGLLTAMGLEKQIRIAFDEWNLRGWHHPSLQSVDPAEYLKTRDLNDENRRYTMADAVFAGCFLNMCLRNCDLVGMANFAPSVNTRGCIFTHPEGIVLRSTYHVFDLYVNELGETVLDTYAEEQPRLRFRGKEGKAVEAAGLDVIATVDMKEEVVVAAVNKDPRNMHKLEFEWFGASMPWRYTIRTLMGKDTESYNDIDHNDAVPGAPIVSNYSPVTAIVLPPHSVNIIRFMNQ